MLKTRFFLLMVSFVLFITMSRQVSAEISIGQSFKDHLSGNMVKGSGTVDRILPDVNKTFKYQVFALKVANDHTILITHNIDLSSRVKNLSIGDTVQFYGEYEWNDKGGIISWTHDDPNGLCTGGWLKHQDKSYY